MVRVFVVRLDLDEVLITFPEAFHRDAHSLPPLLPGSYGGGYEAGLPTALQLRRLPKQHMPAALTTLWLFFNLINLVNYYNKG